MSWQASWPSASVVAPATWRSVVEQLLMRRGDTRVESTRSQPYRTRSCHLEVQLWYDAGRSALRTLDAVLAFGRGRAVVRGFRSTSRPTAAVQVMVETLSCGKLSMAQRSRWCAPGRVAGEPHVVPISAGERCPWRCPTVPRPASGRSPWKQSSPSGRKLAR
jgi:hypothetical protein